MVTANLLAEVDVAGACLITTRPALTRLEGPLYGALWESNRRPILTIRVAAYL